MNERLTTFQGQPVSYQNTVAVKSGVSCDVYTFDGDSTRDLGIISVKTGEKTPLQKVLGGEETIEGHISGDGELTVQNPQGQHIRYVFPDTKIDKVEVRVGDRMQWKSINELVLYEICTPPYSDGRYQDIDEDKI